uniref:Uncharacterized protein n=1 Tax=Rhizophora mucronata TaxID=61149 RepID=A0A2P2P9R5_RHIMU
MVTLDDEADDDSDGEIALFLS